MKRHITALLLSFTLCAGTFAASDKSPQEAYIQKYAGIAVREMYRSGVPASITLAQGLLESRYGQSELATKGNNHFGIKCHDWTGKKMYHDDDAKGECFRVYSTAEESFRDHSDFLRYRDRYKSLFDNKTTDYKAWAYGLKKAGYATDPAYPTKLIKLIEDYHLYDYDNMGESSMESKSGRSRRHGSDDSSKRRKKSEGTAKSRSSSSSSYASAPAEVAPSVPSSPLEMEEPRKVKAASSGEKFSFALSRQVYSVNGVRFVYANEGETYSSIADMYNLFPKEILKFNDIGKDRALQAGETVYIEAKKNQTSKGLDKYISDEGGETMWELSQRFALKLKALCKMNPYGENYVSVPGDEFKLR